jgi:hypothetical protein
MITPLLTIKEKLRDRDKNILQRFVQIFQIEVGENIFVIPHFFLLLTKISTNVAIQTE